ncbi:ABC transporter ATP-binding protein [Labrys wisconsinensis]|uniref:ABC-type Fe3+/spermidine/putrescine transport system ATPase subunit n=1 Tax=Labrys wisconsinensis TaxID=425677 RepID=A0ABU0J3M1_9HYPH|nr:ABC transporter ATP-binding protein [Labrys wisconsinensis]MDQ0468865.1 ABC-type Fe3+/spermidine/putrescine transport system ATPase subunit [Labrys wisconsinensis]
MGLALEAITKAYGTVTVLEPVSLDVADGEFLTILGPSGSGKTTILRLVAGFTQPTSGRLRFGGQDITAVPTNRRPFNTVFQDYALFPHMTVEQNVGYGLMVRGQAKAEIRRKVLATLEIVGLGAMLGRYPAQLSGGQKQRVALARAIVCEPQLILLDEPLAALDAGMRRQMQLFLKDLQKRIAITFLFVTHDQDEAITMSDRIVVMNRGRIEQTGKPKDIYYAPGSPFVAGFFGDNNLMDAVARNGTVESPVGALAHAAAAGQGPVLLAVRPEKIVFGERPDTLAIPCRVEDVIFVGATTHVRMRPERAPSQVLLAKVTSDRGRGGLEAGAAVTVSISAADVAIVPAEAA